MQPSCLRQEICEIQLRISRRKRFSLQKSIGQKVFTPKLPTEFATGFSFGKQDVSFFCRIALFMELGLTLKWVRTHQSRNANKCDKSKSAFGRGHASLENIAGAFVVLLVGLSAASLVLVTELVATMAVKWRSTEQFVHEKQVEFAASAPPTDVDIET